MISRQDNITINATEMAQEGEKWLNLVKHRDQCFAVLNVIVSYKMWNLVSSLSTICIRNGSFPAEVISSLKPLSLLLKSVLFWAITRRRV
jgi:hypothetical protein